MQWTPDGRHSGVKPNTTHLDPPLPLEVKDCLGLLDGEGGEDVPIFGQLLLLGVGLEARVGLAIPDMVEDIFSPPEVEPGPPVCTHHPLFLSRSAHDISPVIVHAGEILMWNGAYEMEVVKGDSTDGDVEVTWALGATLPPTRLAPASQLLRAVREWKRAKESQKGTWTVTCPCECEVCIVFYPVFVRSTRELRDTVLRIRKCFRFGQARRRSRGQLCPTVPEHQCARPGRIACGRAWPHGDRAASSAIAPENERKWNSVTIHAKFARNLREIRVCMPSSSAGATPADARAAIPAAPCTRRPRPRGRRKPCVGDGGHGLPRLPPPHHLPLHAAVPAPVRMEARPPGTEAGKGGVRGDDFGGRVGDVGWAAGAAPENYLPLCHDVPQPRGRVEGGGDDYCPLQILAARRALENGLLRAG